MGARNWGDLQKRETKVIYLGRYNNNSYGRASHDKLLQNWRWQRFWRRWRLGKKGVSDSSYDPSDYFQNFDDGMGCTEPDNLSFVQGYEGEVVDRLVRPSFSTGNFIAA